MIPNLTLIGESINDSISSTRKLFDASDLNGIRQLARTQADGGADYIDVNVGNRPPEFLAEIVRQVQQATSKPISIDTPDPAMAEAALKAYDIARAGGKPAILNSVSQLRAEMLDLRRIAPVRPILLVSERLTDGSAYQNHTAGEVHETAQLLLAEARRKGFAPDDCIIDPAISPIGTDSEGQLPRVLGAMELMHADPTFAGVHRSAGLSNFTVMLPPARKDGSPVRNPLENAFLTLAVPLGLDYVIGSVKRRYELLADDDPALAVVRDCLKLPGFDAIMRVREFYTAT